MSSSIPSARATATAAVAFSALCRPGIGNVSLSIVCDILPARSRKRTEKRDCPLRVIDIDEAHVGLRVFAISEHTPVFQLADQTLHDRMIRAHDREPVERHVLDEGAKRVLHGIECFEMIEVLRIDIGDDSDIGRQLQKRAVGSRRPRPPSSRRRRAAHWYRRH